MMASIGTIDEAKQELADFITDNFEHLAAIVEKAPTSYSIRSMSLAQDEAWIIGFKRCLAELQRIARNESKISSIKENT